MVRFMCIAYPVHIYLENQKLNLFKYSITKYNLLLYSYPAY